MANEALIERLKQGVEVWNAWRRQERNFGEVLDLQDADLRGLGLGGPIQGAILSGANLRGADLTKANLGEAELTYTIFSGTNLQEANLSRANLSRATLVGANLFRADLSGALLTNADLTGANLTDCSIYGVSAWDLTLSEETEQQTLNILADLRNLLRPIGPEEVPPTTTVDDLEAAQFVYLLRGRERIRQIEKVRRVMEVIGLDADDIVRSPTTVQDPTSEGDQTGPESQETKVVDPTVAEQDGAPGVDETKRNMRSAMAELDPDIRDAVIKDLNRSFLPSPIVMDRIWQLIVGAFIIVFVISALALCVGALWLSKTAEIQMLLTVVTTIAGVLAGFISGRASTSASSS